MAAMISSLSGIALLSSHSYPPADACIHRSPEDPDRVLVKRIVAVEGDTVRTLPPYPENEVTIPQGHVWVEGYISSPAVLLNLDAFTEI
jgi:inner membrane protease subunit 2